MCDIILEEIIKFIITINRNETTLNIIKEKEEISKIIDLYYIIHYITASEKIILDKIILNIFVYFNYVKIKK